MARATRSSTTQVDEKDNNTTDTPPQPRKGQAKKRKRTSIADPNDQPLIKQPRTDDIKEESPEGEDKALVEDEQMEAEMPSSGEVPLRAEDASKILEILESIDSQGLLDRVFPLSTEQENSSTNAIAGPSSNSQSHSMRALLKDCDRYSLKVLRSAVQQLLPISTHPRSPSSPPAAEQLRFCSLALSLLDQASLHAAPVPPNSSGLLPEFKSEPSSALNDISSPQKYALVQRLPTGDYWTSLNSGTPHDGKELRDLPTAHAELVSIFPTSSSYHSKLERPVTLGSYSLKKASHGVPFYQKEQQRRVACGRYLSYGPYASFAPVFDHDGAEVGRLTMGEVIFQQERKRRVEQMKARLSGGSVIKANSEKSLKQKEKQREVDLDKSLEGLLSLEQVESLKSTLGSVELEHAVQELLGRNAKAMERLEELQLQRLGGDGGGSSTVKVSSEEWDLGILDSLTVLASLRPRSGKTDDEHPPLIPTASALRKLHRTLPLDDQGGWYGTLPPGRATAARDNTTIQIRKGVPALPSVPATPVTNISPVTPAPKAVAPATSNSTSYPNYSYQQQNYPQTNATSQQTPYRGAYGSYTPSQTTSYYQYQSQSGTTTTPYNTSQYPTTQQPYAYGNAAWYNYQPPAPQSGTSSSGRATPQTTATSMAQSYSSYYSTTQQQSQPQSQRAVANTVLTAATNKGYQPSAWSTAAAQSYNAPTLPAHLRPATGGTPGTPSTPQTGFQPYYGGTYTTPTQSAR
ncbi:hypothetical protein C8Q75DRAFT_556825 [Abortiporus biennis]|nr:hypothetical protein C8Q75DRAFT_556825 [Abortiporus biennis]